jgi:hypothetical protein
MFVFGTGNTIDAFPSIPILADERSHLVTANIYDKIMLALFL